MLIKPEKNPEQTESGLWLSEHKKPEQTGTVVAVGTCEHPLRAEALAIADEIAPRISDLGLDLQDRAVNMLRALAKREPLVKEGDYVVFGWNVGQEIRIDDDIYLLMRESDILCVLEAEPV